MANSIQNERKANQSGKKLRILGRCEHNIDYDSECTWCLVDKGLLLDG